MTTDDSDVLLSRRTGLAPRTRRPVYRPSSMRPNKWSVDDIDNLRPMRLNLRGDDLHPHMHGGGLGRHRGHQRMSTPSDIMLFYVDYYESEFARDRHVVKDGRPESWWQARPAQH